MTKTWDELFPDGRVVYYEGDDPESFAAEMLTEFGVDVRSPAPHCWCEGHGAQHPAGWDLPTCRPFGGRPFFIPPGLVQAIYGSERWVIGS